ncbi:MAG: glycosyltransferase, partial [Halofilum sp. (in: g-proteobacteria)]
GYAPSVRLFEAAACGTPIVSDRCPGIDELFAPDREIVLADSAEDARACIRDLPEERRRELGDAARRRVLAEHTSAHRARDLEDYVAECVGVAEVAV